MISDADSSERRSQTDRRGADRQGKYDRIRIDHGRAFHRLEIICWLRRDKPNIAQPKSGLFLLAKAYSHNRRDRVG